jgi:hypothetical protein
MIKRVIVIFLVCMSFAACSYHLRQELTPSGATVHIEVQANYLPDGWSGLLSSNYPGALAIVNRDLIFDCPGIGSKPWMRKLEHPIRIRLDEITGFTLTEDGAMGKKVIVVKSEDMAFEFLAADAGQFAAIYQSLKNAR